MFNVTNSEWARLRFNRRLNEIGLGTARCFDLPCALLELGVVLTGIGEEEVDPRRQFMAGFVPTLRTPVEALVVNFIGLLKQLFMRGSIVPIRHLWVLKREGPSQAMAGLLAQDSVLPTRCHRPSTLAFRADLENTTTSILAVAHDG